MAVKSFAELPSDASKTFIYTSNKLHLMALEPLLSFGMGKSAAAHMIHYLAEVYKPSGYKYVVHICDEICNANEDIHAIGSITWMSVNRMESLRMINLMLRLMANTTLSWLKKNTKGLGIRLL
jgi:hypothetical protein